MQEQKIYRFLQTMTRPFGLVIVCISEKQKDLKGGVAGYDPDKYLRMYENAEGSTSREKINAMRRENYAEHKEKINAQKRAGYAVRVKEKKNLTQKASSGILQPSEKVLKETKDYEPDIRIPIGVGAKAKDILVELPNREQVRLAPGTRITNVEIIAGKGRNRKIDEIDNLLEKFPGTDAESWQKKKGIGIVDYHGENYRANIHWYEEPSIGRVKFKVKPDADGNWFYED